MSGAPWRQTFELLRGSVLLMRAAGIRLLWFVLLSQLLIAVIALPLIRWTFQRSLRSVGMTGLDFGSLRLAQVTPITLLLLGVVCVLAFWVVSLQFGVLLLVLHGAQRLAEPSTAVYPKAPAKLQVSDDPAASFATALPHLWRKLLRPSSLPLLGYLFFLLPLSGFGFASALTRNISIPLFISNELSKSTAGAAILIILLTATAFANLRLSLTMPIFALTEATGSQATRTSRRLTRGWGGVQLAAAILCVVLVAGVLAAVLAAVGLAPTALADRLWPEASVAVAALSLGVAQLAGALLGGLVVACIAGVLLTYLRHRPGRAGREGRDGTLQQHVQPHRKQQLPSLKNSSRSRRAYVAVAVVCALLLSFGNLRIVERLDEGGDTLVLSHRGHSAGGVENTISGLEAAHALGVTLVEVDVMQAADGGFVLMHDVELSRLAGESLWVKDLTVPQLTALTVRNSGGYADRIPALSAYVQRAEELGVRLLIEIKMSGAETDDHVDLLLAELSELGVLEDHSYHSLDAPSVARLKQLHPQLNVGYTMAFAADRAPDTPADFIVVEQWTASERVQRSAESAGLGFMTWTVNDEAGIREHLRRGVDGIISDRPDLALAEQARITEQRGHASILADALRRFAFTG